MEKSALLEDGQGRVGKQSRIRKQIADQQSRVGKQTRVRKHGRVRKQLTDLHSRVGAELSRVIICAQVEDERSSVAEVKICKVRYRVRCAPVEDEQCTAE